MAKELEDAMEVLGMERPGSFWKRMGRLSERHPREPEPFQRTYAYEILTKFIPPTNEGPSHLPPPTQSSSAEVAAVDSNEGASEP